ncbi:hypothetical protein GF359_04525 [candidate division WOR-3 bacterium]|uniref:Uncharacterized protein n=1 Tax=candidate division WOR-3 bacterium TaxID=2052148 RepID=A0A9D5K996_UNCW3|nr:hypothetical protein [candidate division WOR-3 bacterium]MBD3364460.1 hypothetical protein [candidate division WOR-3 bacterium]
MAEEKIEDVLREIENSWLLKKLSAVKEIDAKSARDKSKKIEEAWVTFFDELTPVKLRFSHGETEKFSFDALAELSQPAIEKMIKAWLRSNLSTDLRKRIEAIDRWMFAALSRLPQKILEESVTLRKESGAVHRKIVEKTREGKQVTVSGFLDGLADAYLEHSSDWEGLRLFGLMLAKIASLRQQGADLLQRAATGPLGEKIAPIEGKIDEAARSIEDAKGRIIVWAILIMGIFAVVLGLIVALVPAAVRMGGASIPVVMAGLAIVVAGVILLLFYLFGRKDGAKPRHGLTAGLIMTACLLVSWLAVTIWLSIAYPDVLTPPPDPHRVDTTFVIKTDTLTETKVDTVEILDTVQVREEKDSRIFLNRGGR